MSSNLRLLHTIADHQEKKEFQQFDWWRVKVCPLALHIGGQSSKDNTLQNAYMVAFFVSFGAKSFSSQQKFRARQE
jgi:hypothetical protein